MEYGRVMGFRASKLEHWQEVAARRLQSIWKASGVSQEYLAGELGISSPGQVSQMLTGKRPISTLHAAKFAAALGCRVDDFSPELADQIRMMAATVAWPATSHRSWPFTTSRSDYDALAAHHKRDIAIYIKERVALANSRPMRPEAAAPPGPAKAAGPGPQDKSPQPRGRRAAA